MALLLLLPGFAVSLWWVLLQLWLTPTVFWALAGGLIAGVILEIRFLRRRHVIGTVEHELTHAIFALLFFKRVEEFRVSRDGSSGYVSHSGAAAASWDWM